MNSPVCVICDISQTYLNFLTDLILPEYFNIQDLVDMVDYILGLLCIVCIVVSVPVCGSLLFFYRSIHSTKKNILTRLDELFVITCTFYVCMQCIVCLFSLLNDFRNGYLYLTFYIIQYGSLALCLTIAIALSCSRVFIIIRVSLRAGVITSIRIACFSRQSFITWIMRRFRTLYSSSSSSSHILSPQQLEFTISIQRKVSKQPFLFCFCF